VAISVFHIQPVEAGTIVVPDDYPSIQQAVDNAHDGDTIYVRYGHYGENVVIRKPLTLVGEKPETSPSTWNYPRVIGTLRIEGHSVRVKRFRVVPNWFPVVGITMFNATNCEITQTMAYGDEPGPAIWIQSSFNNTIAYNWVAGVDWRGLIRLTDSQNNSIIGNFIPYMGGSYGLYFENSSHNRILHNNFIDNLQQVHLENSSNNTWNGDYPQGGNYWSDYNGTDSNGDGIGDNPYVIDENNQDNYPLIAQYSFSDIGITEVVPSKTVFNENYTLTTNVTLLNYGWNATAFGITFETNLTIIEAKMISLDSANYTTLVFSWDTDGLIVGSYTLYVRVELSEDADPLDNFAEIRIIITDISGDVNGDFKVTLQDLVILAKAYGAEPTDANWNSNADIDDNGVVGLSDLVILAMHYGE
jgi:hypothetical protein